MNLLSKYKKNDLFIIGATFLVVLVAFVGAISLPNRFKSNYQGTSSAAGSPCQFITADPGSNVTFCDTFDNPFPVNSRAGQLDSNVWGVSRGTGDVNLGGQAYNEWASTLIEKCDGTTPRVLTPNDVIICNGQLREATNDNINGGFDAGTVTVLAMYPKQPFDFAGRTGTVVFDVTNDTQGIHAAWPEFWLTDLPVPAPFNHFDSWIAFPKNGFGVRFSSGVTPGQWGECPNGNNLGSSRWTVDSAVVIRNYIYDDTEGYGTRTNMNVTKLDCVIASSGPNGGTNHVELRISQNQIDVYATDAGVAPSSTTLRHIAVITNTNLTLSRGLIWLEDVHYNADKGGTPSQREHTFTWDNVGFDGPFTYRDFSYDALDSLTPRTNGANLGKVSLPNQTASWDVLNMPANPQASVVRVLFNFNQEVNPAPSAINVIVNGHAHSEPFPYPDPQVINTWRTMAVTIPITDLVAGTNVVQIGANVALVTANVNIVLVDVPGGVPVLPGSNNTYPGVSSTGSPTPTPTPPVVGTATIAVNPSADSVVVGQTVTKTISVNSGSTGINAVQTTVSYPSNLLQQTGITYGSAFPVQAQEILGTGTVTFDRGTTGSVTGVNNIATITFTALATGNATISLSNSQVFNSSTNQDIFSSATGGTITILVPTPTPTNTPTPTPTPIPTNTPTPTRTPTPTPTFTPTPTPTKIGDVNHDGVVDLLDFSIMLSAWGTNNAISDINHDNTVNLQDFSILFSHWGL